MESYSKQLPNTYVKTSSDWRVGSGETMQLTAEEEINWQEVRKTNVVNRKFC